MPSRECEELEAAIEAWREFGEELEPQVVVAFVERIGKRIDARARELADARDGRRRAARAGARARLRSADSASRCRSSRASFAGELVMAIDLAYDLRD
jgi:hypothetical protein